MTELEAAILMWNQVLEDHADVLTSKQILLITSTIKFLQVLKALKEQQQ